MQANAVRRHPSNEDSSSKDANEELPDTKATSTAQSGRASRPDLMEENDEFWGSSPEREAKYKELLEYITYLEGKNSQLEYSKAGYNPFMPLPPRPPPPRPLSSMPFPSMSLPLPKIETEWRLELSCKRRVGPPLSGRDTEAEPDDEETVEQSQQARPAGGPVLRRWREFNYDNQYVNTTMEIRSPLLFDALRDTIKAEQHSEYVALHNFPVIFREPYMLLFHYWADIQSKIDASGGSTKKYLQFLLSTLEQQCPTVGRFAIDLANKSVTDGSIPSNMATVSTWHYGLQPVRRLTSGLYSGHSQWMWTAFKWLVLPTSTWLVQLHRSSGWEKVPEYI